MARWLNIASVVILGLTVTSPLAKASDSDIAEAASPAAAIPAAAGASADTTLLLDVQINGHPVGKIGEFTLRRGRLLARASELQELGLRVPPSSPATTGGLISLSDLPGLRWSLDQENEVLYITAATGSLLPNLLQPIGREGPEGRREIESGTGMTVNYDIVHTVSNAGYGANGSFELRAFSPYGIVSSNWLAYAGADDSGSRKNNAVRLDSIYTFADVNTLRRYSLGDFITGSLGWTRPVHLTGVQIRSDFSMRPDLITFPLPTLTGSTAVPSTVNVLADGNLVASSEVGAGPFEVSQLPVVSGAGTVSMTVTNAQGQQVTLNQPFYASSELLSPGLQSFFAQAGLVRRNWGTASYDYGKMAGAAIYRRGLSSKITIEGSAEGTVDVLAAGWGAQMQIGHLGVVSFSAVPSVSSGRTRVQLSAGAQRIGRVFSLGGAAIIATHGYRDVASMNGDGVPRKQLSAFTSLSLRRIGSAGIAYAGVDQDPSPNPIRSNLVSAEKSHVVSASYSVQFRHFSIYASEFKNLAGAKGSSGLQAGFTIPLGRRSWTGVSATSDGNTQLQAQQTAPQIGDWGYQAYVSAGNANHEFAEVEYKSPVGRFMAGVDTNDGQATFRAESQGALSFLDLGRFPSNEIFDSFAIVDTSPLPHVRVRQENRDVGSTNSSGRLLVPDMRSFDINHIAIEATDVPPDARLSTDNQAMRPQDRSGIVVKFPIKISHAALLQLVDASGLPLPLGSVATLKGSSAVSPIGYDGKVYIEDLGAHNEVTVERNDGRRCTVVFDYHPAPGDIPSIGPLRCQEQMR